MNDNKRTAQEIVVNGVALCAAIDNVIAQHGPGVPWWKIRSGQQNVAAEPFKHQQPTEVQLTLPKLKKKEDA